MDIDLNLILSIIATVKQIKLYNVIEKRFKPNLKIIKGKELVFTYKFKGKKQITILKFKTK